MYLAEKDSMRPLFNHPSLDSPTTTSYRSTRMKTQITMGDSKDLIAVIHFFSSLGSLQFRKGVVLQFLSLPFLHAFLSCFTFTFLMFISCLFLMTQLLCICCVPHVYHSDTLCCPTVHHDDTSCTISIYS